MAEIVEYPEELVERKAPRFEQPTLAIAIAAAGVGAVLVGDALPFGWGSSGGRSVFALVFAGDYAGSPWFFAEYLVIPIALAVALALATRGWLRVAFAGLIAGVGAQAYASGLTMLGSDIALAPRTYGPLSGSVVFVLGAALAVTGGLLLYSRVARRGDATWAPGLGRVSRLSAAAAAVGLVVSASIPTTHGDLSLLATHGGQRWFALEPLAVALVVLGIAGPSARRLDQRFLGGFMAGLGVVSATFFTGYAGFGHEVSGVGPGTYVGLAAALILLVAGALAVWSGNKTAADPREPADVPANGAAPPSQVTQYLCASAHLDEKFAREVIRNVVEEEHRAVAPSFGVDLVTVVRHCLAARDRKVVRDLFLTMLAIALGIVAAYHHSHSLLAVVLILLGAWIAVALEYWVAHDRIVVRHLAGSDPDYDSAAAHLAPGDEDRLRALLTAEHGNVIVYSGYRPFVGSGHESGGWSFALNVAKGRKVSGGEEATPKAFTVEELYARIGDDVLGLKLPGVTVDDQLYVDGRDVQADKRFIQDTFGRPNALIDDGLLREFVRTPTQAIRHYRCVRVSAWGGEIVLSMFLNFHRVGASLFAEARYFVLAPLKQDYHRLDEVRPNASLPERIRGVAPSLFLAPLVLAGAVFETIALPTRASSGARRRRDTRKRIKRDPNFDYGAKTSVRELAQADRYRRYFQQVDREMYAKIVERQILDSFVAFLRSKDIDTSEFEEREAAILNYGVIVSGGSLQAQSVAAGSGATATSGSRAQQAAGAARRAATRKAG